MEPLRTHVLDQLEKFARIEFTPRPAPATACPKPRLKVGRALSVSRKGTRLTACIVRDIRKAFAAGAQVSEIASRFKITTVTARSIRDRRTWADVE